MPEGFREGQRKALERYLQTGERRPSWETVEMRGLHRDGHEIDLRISFPALETAAATGSPGSSATRATTRRRACHDR